MSGWVLTGSEPLPGLQVRSNCGTRTVVPAQLRTASSMFRLQGPPPPFGLPAAVTYCHEGRSIAGLSAVRIEQTTSPAPPDLGVQSSQPTLPDDVEQSGTR